MSENLTKVESGRIYVFRLFPKWKMIAFSTGLSDLRVQYFAPFKKATTSKAIQPSKFTQS